MSEHDRQEDEMTAAVEQVGHALKQSLPAVNTELRRDLWPAVRRRLEQRPARALWPAVPWYDWALMGASVAVFAFFPQLTLMLAYHL
jgi:hypothetical protein